MQYRTHCNSLVLYIQRSTPDPIGGSGHSSPEIVTHMYFPSWIQKFQNKNFQKKISKKIFFLQKRLKSVFLKFGHLFLKNIFLTQLHTLTLPSQLQTYIHRHFSLSYIEAILHRSILKHLNSICHYRISIN